MEGIKKEEADKVLLKSVIDKEKSKTEILALDGEDTNYKDYYDILKSFHSNYYVNNKLEPSKTDEEELDSIFKINKNEAEVYIKMEEFLFKYCDNLLKITPLAQANHFPATREYYQNLKEQLLVTKGSPFAQYKNFIVMFQDYYLYNTIEKWFIGKKETQEYIQAGKNAEKKDGVIKKNIRFQKILTLVPEVKSLKDTDIESLLDMKEISERIGNFDQEKGIQNKYNELFILLMENLSGIINKDISKWRQNPLEVINECNRLFDSQIKTYKEEKNIVEITYKDAESQEMILEKKLTILEEKVKLVYIQMLEEAAKTPNFLDLDKKQIKQIANYYKKDIIASAQLSKQIEKGIIQQYSPTKQIWLENILKFADAKNTAKKTVGDDCADLNSIANKSTHSTLYREKVPDKVNVKDKTDDDIYNGVLGNTEHMCFHVSTCEVTCKSKEEKKAAHAYRVGDPILYFSEIGYHFKNLTYKNLKEELTAIKSNQVMQKEGLIKIAIDNHFHGYQNISNPIMAL